MVKRIRIFFALVFFVGIILMFVDYTGPLCQHLPWLAKFQFWSALTSDTIAGAVCAAIIISLTLLLGRIYCSTICPLGVFQDIIARISLKLRRGRYTYSKAKKWCRYTFLALIIVLFQFGLSSILAPYSAFGRILSTMVQPLYIWCNNILADIAESMDSYMFYHEDMMHVSLLTLGVAIATLVIVGSLAAKGGRTYCNTVCPVGTILSLFARFSMLKMNIDADKCKNCGKCVRNCKASCIDLKNHEIDYSRCVVCGDCLEQCGFLAMEYGHWTSEGFNSVARGLKPTRNREERIAKRFEDRHADKGRRGFLVTMAMATTAAALAQEKKKVDGGLAAIEDKQEPHRRTPILPPGAVSMQQMSKHCTACQLCVSACPNRVLRPSTSIDHFMQPVSGYELGYCRPECNACGSVCPSGAIHFVSKEQKVSIKKGTAIFLHKNCLALSQEADCGLCADNCPTGAITMVHTNPNDESSPRMPSVDESRCIGCGACENMCPARPFSAIYVEGIDVQKEV